MSLLKNIMRPFIEFSDKEEPSEEKSATVKTGKIEAPAPSHSASSNAPASFTGGAAAASDYQRHFEELIEEANARDPLFHGTDYKEFIDSKADVEAIADEATRYRTAFNVLKRTGLTKEKLDKTGNEYIKLIDRDLKEFETAYVQQYKTNVEGKEQLLQKKAQELQAINEKIATLNEEIRQLSQEVNESKNRLNVNKNSFIQAGENKKKEIENELRKIDKYFS